MVNVSTSVEKTLRLRSKTCIENFNYVFLFVNVTLSQAGEFLVNHVGIKPGSIKLVHLIDVVYYVLIYLLRTTGSVINKTLLNILSQLESMRDCNYYGWKILFWFTKLLRLLCCCFLKNTFQPFEK